MSGLGDTLRCKKGYLDNCVKPRVVVSQSLYQRTRVPENSRANTYSAARLSARSRARICRHVATTGKRLREVIPRTRHPSSRPANHAGNATATTTQTDSALHTSTRFHINTMMINDRLDEKPGCVPHSLDAALRLGIWLTTLATWPADQFATSAGPQSRSLKVQSEL